MDTIQQSAPHLGLRAAKKLNPKLQCWRWDEGFTCFNTFEPGCWVPVGTPKWLPHCIYAVTGSKKEKPSWAPSPQQLKDASSLKRSTDAGKKLKPIGNFPHAAGLPTELLFKRGLHHKRN